MRSGLIVTQVFTYLALGLVLIARGEWKLGLAQWLLAAVQALVFA